MSTHEKRERRVKAFAKLQNQLSVIERTGTKEDKKLVKQLRTLTAKLSVA